MRARKRIGAVLLASGLAAPVCAETAGVLGVVEVRASRSAGAVGPATLSPTQALELPFSTSVLDPADFTERALRSMADLADYTPGVSRSSNYWGIDTPTFQLRGFNAGSGTSYYRDGFRYQARGPVSLANVEQVEILRGPQSALYGWAEPGGAVHLRTKLPTRERLRRVELGVNAWGQATASADLGGALGERDAFRFIFAREQGEGFRKHQSMQQTLLAPSWLRDFGGGRNLRVTAEWLDDRREPDYGVPALDGRPAPVSRRQAYTEGWGRQHSRSQRLSAHWEQPAGGGRLAAAVSHYSFRYLEYHDAQSDSTSGRTLLRGYERYPERYRWLTGYLDWSRDFAAGGGRHTFSTRLEVAREVREMERGEWDTYPSVDILAPVRGLAWAPSADFTVYDQSWRNWSIGLVLQDEIRAGNWTWLLGARIGHLRQVFDFVEHEPSPSSRHQEQRDTSVTPRIGVSWRPLPWLALHANYAAGVLPELPQRRSFDGRAFDPAEGRQWEAGLKLQPESGDWLAALTSFDIVRENVLTRDPAHAGFSIATGEQRSRGVELEWQGRLASGWFLAAQATWMDTEIVSDERYRPGNRLPYAARFGASAWLRHTLPEAVGGRWRLAVGAVHQGARWADFANTVRLPSYTRFDAGATWLAHGWSATLSIENLSGRRYWSSGVENRPAVIYPGAPRTVSLRVSVDF